MAMEFLDKNGFTYFWNKLKARLSNKQDSLISGTNIKTINNNSLLGSGDISVQTPLSFDTEPTANSTNPVTSSGIKRYVDDSIPAQATESVTGTVKLNPSESVTLNSDGQLDVGGRLGQMSDTNGIFHPKTADPRKVGNYSFMITDAKGLNMNPARVFGILTGYNQTLTESHPAGSTSYTVANTYENRIRCSVLSNGGFIALSEADAVANRVTYVQSVTIDGKTFTPSSSTDDSSKPITITVATSVNPDSATSSIRMFGTISGGYCSQYIGQDVGGASGVSLIIGQNAFTKSGNGNVMVGLSLFNNGNGNALFGRYHISTKNRWLMAGAGHDNTNGRSEAGVAVGQWSLIDANTLFAVGNGTSHTERKNAFEVVADGIVLLSPNGKRWKVAVNNSGSLVTSAL